MGRLNFPEDDTEVHLEKTASSKFIGVTYKKNLAKWEVQRKSKNEKKKIYHGIYKDEKIAAHASDTLARNLIANGEHHRLNFPEDETEVHPKTDRDNYIGVSYNKKQERWRAVRWSKNEKQSVFKGYYKDK